jgi:hypothetical protein
MTHLTRIATALACLALAACSENPAETRSVAEQFPLRSTWSASATPVGTSTVRATLSFKQYAGFRAEASVTITGAASSTYQWRIFRGNCATTAVGTATTPGLFIFATTQSYPDATTNASGTGTATRIIAGQIDSLTAYSVRVRASQTATNWNGTSPIACGNLQRS